MAIYNLRVSSAKGRSVLEKFNYINREEKYSHLQNEKYDDFIYSENMNMPSFAIDNPKAFWESVELYERSNANHFREIEFTIPHELNEEERIEVATDFAKRLFKDEYVYSLAIHNKKSSIDNIDNIHCHIIFSERKLDGIDRNEEEFFKRFNSTNPSLGGCEKVDWSRKSILYGIRKEWETTANEYLVNYNTSITSQSLKTQRLRALFDENYLKAEMLDRKGVNINLQTFKYSYDSEYRETAIEYFEECKRIKEYKEKLYNLRCQNFEEENEKAKERFLKGEVEEINFSIFDVEKNETINQESYQQAQELVNSIVANNISILENNRRIDELSNISELELEESALNILTNNEYSANLIELNKLEELYEVTPLKEHFAYKERKDELDNYFYELSQDKDLQEKVFELKEKMLNDNEIIIERLKSENDTLKTDYSLEDTIETRKVLEDNYNILISTAKDLKKIKTDIYNFRQTEMDKQKILFDIYKNMNREDIIEKYNELDSWKKELSIITEENKKEELLEKINAREGGLIKFNIKNNIDIELESIMNEKEKDLLKLLDLQNQTQDKFKATNDLLNTYSNNNSDETIKEITEEYNYENVFRTSMDIQVLINRNEERIKQIQSITDSDIENRALNILTKNEFSKNQKELSSLEELYEATPLKEHFAYKERKAELEDYFEKLKNSEYFQNKVGKIKENIKEKYKLEVDHLGEELKDLRQSQYKNIYKEISDESTVLSKIIQRETFNSLSDLYEKAKKTDQRVKDYKNKLNERDILFDIYKNMNREDIIEKYNELDSWKKELTTITEENIKEELLERINAREGGLIKFNIKNNITEKVDEELQKRKEIFKSLRQEQDDVKGQIKYLTDINKVLKEKIKDVNIQESNKLKLEYKLIEEQDITKELPLVNRLYNKLLYNSKIDDISPNQEENKFKINLSTSEKIELRTMLVDNINKLVEENKVLEKEYNIEVLKDEKALERYILDSKTNNEYSKELSRMEFYKQKLKKKIDVNFYEFSLKETQKRIDLMLKNNPITDSEKNKVKSTIRSKVLSNLAKIHMNKKQIRLLYSSLKAVNNDVKLMDLFGKTFNKTNNISNPPKYNYSSKIYVLGVDEIVVEEEDIVEKERKRILRGRGIEIEI